MIWISWVGHRGVGGAGPQNAECTVNVMMISMSRFLPLSLRASSPALSRCLHVTSSSASSAEPAPQPQPEAKPFSEMPSRFHRCQRSRFAGTVPIFEALSPLTYKNFYCGPRFHRLWEYWRVFKNLLVLLIFDSTQDQLS